MPELVPETPTKTDLLGLIAAGNEFTVYSDGGWLKLYFTPAGSVLSARAYSGQIKTARRPDLKPALVEDMVDFFLASSIQAPAI